MTALDPVALCEAGGLHRCPYATGERTVLCGCDTERCAERDRLAGEPPRRADPTKPWIIRAETIVETVLDEDDLASAAACLDEAGARIGHLYESAGAEERTQLRHIACALIDLAALLGFDAPRFPGMRP